MRREVAWRVFAGEYNDATVELAGEGERAPSFVLTPLGARINRLFLVGVLTEVENTGTDLEPMLRARVEDPTGTFQVFAGQYQPEATAALGKLTPPAFAAVVGKARLYRPEEGVTYVSVRPEKVKVVQPSVRDYWVLEASRSLKERVAAMREALGLDRPTVDALAGLGHRRAIAEGAVVAAERYGSVDVAKYETMLQDAVQYLLQTPVAATTTEEEALEPREAAVLDLIEAGDAEGKGVPLDELVVAAKKRGLDRRAVETAVDGLLDKRVLYEPKLGRLRKA